MKRELLKMQDWFKLLVLDEAHKMFDRTMKFRECYSFKSFEEEFPSTPIMVLMATLSEQPLHVLCTEHFCKLVLLKNSVNKKNIKINVDKYYIDTRTWWDSVAKQLVAVIQGDFATVYMDFKNDSEPEGSRY